MNELVLVETFSTIELLANTIKAHYQHQIQGNLLRIIGSSNLLLNPAGLLDKVSLGVFEMARDPIVGLKEGPGGFVQGIGTGVQGLVKGVVGGAF